MNRQRLYITSHIEKIEPVYRYSKSKKKNSAPRKLNNAYFFNIGTRKIRVCKLFFSNTLSISNQSITTVEKEVENGIVTQDMRGKHDKHNKIDDQLKQAVRDHISSVPRIESHY